MTKDRARAKAAQYLAWAENAEREAVRLHTSFREAYRDFDWTQPILVGHHSQRRHEKVFERRNSMFARVSQLETKVKRMRLKAENLFRFADTNKGDAEARREQRRVQADELYTVGSPIIDPVFGEGTVRRVNKKTYTVQFRTFTTPRDKSYFMLRR